MGVRLPGKIVEMVFWFALWIAIPAALLYPAVVWMFNHTAYSESSLIEAYIISIGVLFLPTGFLVDFAYRKFILKKQTSN